MPANKLRVLVLGAGFGGLELSTMLAGRLGGKVDITLIDRNDFFYFGFSKLDVMFGRKASDTVKLHYSHILRPEIRFRQETITAIDPVRRRVSTDQNVYESDVLVVALGADYDIPATPGLAEAGYEFYSFGGAEKTGRHLPEVERGDFIVGVTGFPFKCPPAPSEAALLLDEYLRGKGVRQQCSISLVVPFDLPIPPSFGTSKALLRAFEERGIIYVPEIMVGALDPVKRLAILDDGREMPFDLFLGIPEHKVPAVVEVSGLVRNEWVPVDRTNLKTAFPRVYAIGDVTSVGTPKAGMFAEGAARIAAESIIAEFHGKEYSGMYDGNGSCYVEFGEGKVGRADVDFFSGPSATGIHQEASEALAMEKSAYAESRARRWFRDAT